MTRITAWVRTHRGWSAVIAVVLVLGIVGAATSGKPKKAPRPRATAAQHPSAVTPQQGSDYPPRTFADIGAIGAQPASYTVLSDDQIGTASCPGQRLTILVPRLPQRETVTAMLHAFVSRIGPTAVSGVLFAVHKRSEAGTGFTAGRVILDSACTGYPTKQVEIDTGTDLAPNVVAVVKP